MITGEHCVSEQAYKSVCTSAWAYRLRSPSQCGSWRGRSPWWIRGQPVWDLHMYQDPHKSLFLGKGLWTNTASNQYSEVAYMQFVFYEVYWWYGCNFIMHASNTTQSVVLVPHKVFLHSLRKCGKDENKHTHGITDLKLSVAKTNCYNKLTAQDPTALCYRWKHGKQFANTQMR